MPLKLPGTVSNDSVVLSMNSALPLKLLPSIEMISSRSKLSERHRRILEVLDVIDAYRMAERIDRYVHLDAVLNA